MKAGKQFADMKFSELPSAIRSQIALKKGSKHIIEKVEESPGSNVFGYNIKTPRGKLEISARKIQGQWDIEFFD